MQFKAKLKKIYRPDWTISKARTFKKLWLDKNENTDVVLAKQTKKILNKINHKAINSYPNLGPLYHKLSKILKLSPQNILLTAGSDLGIKTVFETFVKEKDLVLRTNPTFAMYSVYSKIFNVRELVLDYQY